MDIVTGRPTLSSIMEIMKVHRGVYAVMIYGHLNNSYSLKLLSEVYGGPRDEYARYVIDHIDRELDSSGGCLVVLGEEYSFGLLRTDSGSTLKLDEYDALHLEEWDLEIFREVLISSPGIDRCMKWDVAFNCEEPEDAQGDIIAVSLLCKRNITL